MNASCQMFQKHSNISIELDSGDNKVEKIAPDIHPSDFKFYQLHSLNVYKFFFASCQNHRQQKYENSKLVDFHKYIIHDSSIIYIIVSNERGVREKMPFYQKR